MKIIDKIETNYRSFKFDIRLKYNIVVICGDSGSGKSLLVQCLRRDIVNAIQNKIYKDSIDKIVVHDAKFNTDIDNIKQLKGKVIIIDNYDALKNNYDWLEKHILTDSDNQYVIIGRDVNGLGLPLNSISKMRLHDNTFKLEYWNGKEFSDA